MTLRLCYLPPVFIDKDFISTLGEGRELSSEETDGFRFAGNCLRAEKAALRLITRAEQNLRGLSRKLQKRGHEPACIQPVLSRLADLGLLDDQRFVRLWLESRLSGRTDSPRRLLSSLRARGIERADAESGLRAALDLDTEWELLLRYVNKLKKSRSFRKNFDKTGAGRSLKFILKSEGFSPQAIQKFEDTDD